MTKPAPKNLNSRFKYIAFTGLAVILSACATTEQVSAPAQIVNIDEALINRSEVVAVVASVDVATDLEQSALRWGYELKRKEALKGLGLWVLTFDCPPGIDPRDASVELERLQPRATVEANHKYLLQSVTTPIGLTSPSQARLYANELIEWPEEGCETKMRIGMIDGQVDPSAISRKDLKIQRRDFVNEKVGQAARNHGTAVAEILVGKGRLNNAELFAASVVAQDENGATYSGVEPILRALDWLVREDVSLINVSLAGPYNGTLAKGFDLAVDKGVMIVAAVGNDGPDSRPRYPAALKSVFAATAVDSAKEVYSKAVRGKHVDFAAPGVDVFVPTKAGGRYISGTSIAAPFATARLAILDGLAKKNDIEEVRAKLSKLTKDLGEGGRDPVFGDGLITADGNCNS
jgi:subtilisin family serine protease